MIDILRSPVVSTRPALSILVAEDNDVLRVAVLGLLRLIGYRADVACDGLEVIEAASVRDYDVIFLDVQMPGMDGLEATARLRQGRRRVRPWIVGVSGEADDRRAYAAGMDEFLVKPLCLGDLARILEHRDRSGEPA